MQVPVKNLLLKHAHFEFSSRLAHRWLLKMASKSIVRSRPFLSAPRRIFATSESTRGLPTYDDLAAIAAERNLYLRLQTLGPFYRIQCRDCNVDGPILGTTSGFLVPPLRLMHADTMQIFTRRKGGEEGDRQRVGIIGLGVLLAFASFAHGYWSGCRKVEILAIKDNEYTHARLVRYYKRMFGFQPVREVGDNGLGDLPYLLVWGGAGTRMDGDLQKILGRCKRMFNRAVT